MVSGNAARTDSRWCLVDGDLSVYIRCLQKTCELDNVAIE